MLPFKINQGLSKNLNTVPIKEGTINYCTDTNQIYIDRKNNSSGIIERICINNLASEAIDGLLSKQDYDKLQYTNMAYGTCTTAAGTSAKVINIANNTNWKLDVGSLIVIKFTNTNTAQNPTFNVNGTGAKKVWYNTGLITTGSLNCAGYAGRYGEYMYDGTQYIFLGWSVDSNTTYTNGSLGSGYGTCGTVAGTLEKAVTLSNYSATTGGIVAVKFNYDVPASATMNINSKGAKPIYYKGKAITEGVICAGEVATFVYDGTNYHLLTVDRNRFFTSLVPFGTRLAPTESAPIQLNAVEYLKVGNYYCSANANAKFITDLPKKDTAFMMAVSSPLATNVDNENGNWVYRLREINFYTGEKYVQYCYSDGSNKWTYGPWKQYLTTMANTAVGSTTQPVYINSSGVVNPISYKVESNVPTNLMVNGKLNENYQPDIYWEEIFNKPIEEINKHLYTINLTEDEIVEGYYTKSSGSSSTQYPIQFVKLKDITIQHINEGFQMLFPSLNANIDSSMLVSSTLQQNVTILSLGEIDLIYIIAQDNIEITGKNIILNTGVWLRTINKDIEEESSSIIDSLYEESLIPSCLYFNKPIITLNLFTNNLVNIDWNEFNPLSSQTIKNKPYGLIQSENKDTFYSNLEYSDYFIPLGGDLETQNITSHFMIHQNGYLLPQINDNVTHPENSGQFIPLQIGDGTLEEALEEAIMGYNFISSQIPPQDKIINSIVKLKEDMKIWVDYNTLYSLMGANTGIDFSFIQGANVDPIETIKEIKTYNIYINENYCGIDLNATEQNPASADLSTFDIIIIYVPNTAIENTTFEKAGIYFVYGYMAVQAILFGVSGKTGVTEWKIPNFISNQVFNKKITKSQIEKDTFSEIGHLHPEACTMMPGFMSPRQAQILQNTKRIRHTSTKAGYYKLGTMLPDSSSNNDVGISFEGWIGPDSTNLGYIDVKLLNRTSDYMGGSIFSSVQTQYINTPDFFNYCDIEIYSKSDKSCDIYLRSSTGACLFDTIWSYWNHSVSYESTSSTPSGTLIWSLSAAANENTEPTLEKQHISNKGSGSLYYPLAFMRKDDSGNYGTVNISGRIGGWEQINSANFDIMMLNRSSARDGNTITATVSAMGEVDAALALCDIVVYKQEDMTDIAYLKTNNYWLFDFDWNTFQHEIIYDGTTVEAPTGELVWALSTAPKSILNTDGSFKTSGNIYVGDTAVSLDGHNHNSSYYTKSQSNSRYYGTTRGTLNVNSLYDGQLGMVASGTNVPCGSNYGVVFTMPYRQLTGNTTPDFGAQIFLPNGDDDTHPNSMFYRTALKDTWNAWNEVATVAQLNQKAPAYTYGTTDLVEGQSTLPAGTLYFVFEE